MKKSLLTICLFLFAFRLAAQPQVLNLSYPSSVNLFDLYEISFSLGQQYSNPYDPDTISVYAVFTAPDNSTRTVNGFYYEGYTFLQNGGCEEATPNPTTNGWRIRFTPTQTGMWVFSIHAKDKNGETVLQRPLGAEYSFTCLLVTNAEGFISVANPRFLKRDVVRNGNRYDHSFFPIGPNVAWYECGDLQCPGGIFDYEKYVDSLDGKGNYMRLWINRFHSISLYGPEYTQQVGGQPVVYFDSTLNQKDAAELDYIITYAAQHDVSVMLSIFTFGDFKYAADVGHVSVNVWENNPFNTVLGTPCHFFTDGDAIRITKNLIRYIIARWGYATNLLCWEFWNEVTNMCIGYKNMERDVLDWHEQMITFVSENDPFNHLVSTSMGSVPAYPHLFQKLYENMDFVQLHDYQNIQKAKSKEQVSKVLFDEALSTHGDYPTKPFFMGEFGFGQSSGPSIYDKDPFGIDLHYALLSSLFSTSMGSGSPWWWQYLSNQHLFCRFKPLLAFCATLPVPSETFVPYTTGQVVLDRLLVFPNNIETYYMKNAAEDTIYGWSQDTAFCYQSLRWLTDSVYMLGDTTGLAWHFKDNAVFDLWGYVYTMNSNKRPQPSSNSNIITIPIDNQPFNTRYVVHWYDSETGLPLSLPSDEVYVHQYLDGVRGIRITFPPSIRDLNQHTINNKFGDVVFKIFKHINIE